MIITRSLITGLEQDHDSMALAEPAKRTSETEFEFPDEVN